MLARHGIELVAEQGYEPKDVDVQSQVLAMKNANPDAVICSCAPEPAAKFYTERRKLTWKAPVVNVFFGKSPKVPELAGQEAVEGVYFTTIFRDFSSTARPMQQALQVLKKYYPQEEPDALHLWGFAGAQVATEALKRMGKDNITRDRFVETLETIKDWKESVVPTVTISKGNAPEHFNNFSRRCYAPDAWTDCRHQQSNSLNLRLRYKAVKSNAELHQLSSVFELMSSNYLGSVPLTRYP